MSDVYIELKSHVWRCVVVKPSHKTVSAAVSEDGAAAYFCVFAGTCGQNVDVRKFRFCQELIVASSNN